MSDTWIEVWSALGRFGYRLALLVGSVVVMAGATVAVLPHVFSVEVFASTTTNVETWVRDSYPDAGEDLLFDSANRTVRWVSDGRLCSARWDGFGGDVEIVEQSCGSDGGTDGG